MKIIFGLGNPGKKYEKTRHNIGRNLIERFALSCGASSFSAKKSLKSCFAQTVINGEKVCLAYSETYMNHSGEAVSALVRYFDVDVKKDLLIVLDEFVLPFGMLRLKPGGGTAGHNGLKSINAHLRNTEYARLRMGIGYTKEDQARLDEKGIKIPLEDYVLSDFFKEEREALEDFYRQGNEALEHWGSQSIAIAMNRVNEPQDSPE